MRDEQRSPEIGQEEASQNNDQWCVEGVFLRKVVLTSLRQIGRRRLHAEREIALWKTGLQYVRHEGCRPQLASLPTTFDQSGFHTRRGLTALVPPSVQGNHYIRSRRWLRDVGLRGRTRFRGFGCGH